MRTQHTQANLLSVSNGVRKCESIAHSFLSIFFPVNPFCVVLELRHTFYVLKSLSLTSESYKAA